MNLLIEKEQKMINKSIKRDLFSTEKIILNYREINHSLLFLSFFAHYTAPLYQFNNNEFVRSFLPILLCVQGLVYEADIKIEDGQKNKLAFNDIQSWIENRNLVISLVKELNLYSSKLENEADNLSEYWRLENKLMKGSEITHEMLIKATELRASDIMMLHHICQKITKIEFNNEVMQTIQAIEIIRDIEADLRQYKNDIINNDFNIYRMYTKVYGVKARAILSDELEKRKKSYDKMICKLPEEYKEKFKDLTERYYTIRPPISVPECILYS